MSSHRASYRILIDWDDDGGLILGGFEAGLQEWSAAGDAALPTVELSTVRAYQGAQSMRIAWPTENPFAFDVTGHGFDDGRFGFDGQTSLTDTEPRVERAVTGLVAGRSYSLSAWVYVPAGASAVYWEVSGVATSASSTTEDAWTEITLDFTAGATTHTLQIRPDAAAFEAEGQAWVDVITLTGPGEDVTDRVLGVRTPLSWRYGRDHARSLSDVAPADMAMEVDNRSRDYSPDNASSPLQDRLAPGRPVVVRATADGQSYALYEGRIDDYDIDPARASRSVKFGVVDSLGRLADGDISTGVYPSVQTGEAISLVLDAAGWPSSRRDLDSGATTARWWSVDGKDALEAIKQLVASEGPPAIAYVSPSGDFVFRDRHHRLLRSASTTSQATFRDTGSEPLFSEPMSYDIGWRDLANRIRQQVEVRRPEPPQVVWEADETFALSAGETRTIAATPDSPVIRAVTPEVGRDLTLRSGDVSVSLAATSGQTIGIRLHAAVASVVAGLQLRAAPITGAYTVQVSAEDPTSITKHGSHRWDADLPWAGVNDTAAIADVVLGQRSERLPIVHIDVVNANATRLGEILDRTLSDRIHIVEDETSTDHDHFIESVEHSIADVGYKHTVTFGCERVREQVADAFTFDVSGRGFDDGSFGLPGFDDPDSVFVLDVSNLDEGLLAH